MVCLNRNSLILYYLALDVLVFVPRRASRLRLSLLDFEKLAANLREVARSPL